MAEKRAQERLLALDATAIGAGQGGQQIHVLDRQVSQRIDLEVAPERLHRIQFGSVGRQEEDVQAGVAVQEVLDAASTMRLEPVPDQHDGPANLPQEVPEERVDLPGGDVGVGMQTEVQVESGAAGVEPQRRDERHLLVATGALVEDGRLADGRPSAAHKGSHQNAAFVEKDEFGAQFTRFF